MPAGRRGAAQPAPGRQVSHHVRKIMLIAGLQRCFEPVVQRVVGQAPFGVPLAELADHRLTVGVRRADSVSWPPSVARRFRTVRRRATARVPFHGPEYQGGQPPAQGIETTSQVPANGPAPIPRLVMPGTVLLGAGSYSRPGPVAAGHCRSLPLGWLPMSVATEVGGTPVPAELAHVAPLHITR